MQDLISNSYSKEEAIRFSQYTISQTDKETIAQAGSDILKILLSSHILVL